MLDPDRGGRAGEGTTVYIKQVKVPVSDLRRSLSWYVALLDLRPFREFVEDDVVRGAVLIHPESGFLIGLRDREVIGGQPSFRGFDLFSIGVSSVQDLHEIAARCDELGVAHGDLTDRGPDGIQLDVTDPDGTVIRFLSPFAPDGPAFAGVEFHGAGAPTFYSSPRLSS
jgi:hypothetical protein